MPSCTRCFTTTCWHFACKIFWQIWKSRWFLRTWVAFGRFFEIFVLDRSIRFENPINERNKVRNSMKASKLFMASKLSSFVGWKFVVSDPREIDSCSWYCNTEPCRTIASWKHSNSFLLSHQTLCTFCYCSCCPSVMFGPIWEIWNVNKSQQARPYSRRPRYVHSWAITIG